jgi:hypothetical protein
MHAIEVAMRAPAQQTVEISGPGENGEERKEEGHAVHNCQELVAPCDCLSHKGHIVGVVHVANEDSGRWGHAVTVGAAADPFNRVVRGGEELSL